MKLPVLGVLGAATLLWIAMLLGEKAFIVLTVVYIAVPVIWCWPEIGLLLTMASIPLELMGVLSDTRQTITLSLAKLFGFLTLAIWVARLALHRRRPVLWTPELAYLAAFTGISAASVAWALDRADALQMVIRLGSAIVLYVLTLNLVTSRAAAVRVVVALMVPTFIVIAFGFMQPYLAGATTRGEVAHGEWGYSAELDYAEADAIGEVVRITGTLGFTDAYAGFLVIVLPVFLFLFQFTRSIWGRAVTTVLILATIASLVLTYSRMGFIVFCLSLLLLLLYRVVRITPARIGVVLLLALASLPVLPDGFWHRVLKIEQYVESESVNRRYDMLRDGVSIASRKWLLGHGIYNMRLVMAEELDYLNRQPAGTHNMYLTLWGDVGVVGVAAYLGFLWQSWQGARLARRRFAAAGDQRMAALAAAVLVSVVAVVVCNIVAETYVIKAWWCVFALGAALRRMSASSPQARGDLAIARVLPVAARGDR
jgi:hypothetical protein